MEKLWPIWEDVSLYVLWGLAVSGLFHNLDGLVTGRLDQSVGHIDTRCRQTAAPSIFSLRAPLKDMVVGTRQCGS
jgi:hypothetical protein